ncbi:MAG: EAL domain-containing protein, partial [Gallionellaceae bacterium]|nr:EAL domain-containing protein [Gallionellaceae bacterium]
VLDIFKGAIHSHGDDIYVLLHKEFLSRKDWEQGMRMLDRMPEWDRYPDFIVASQTRPDIPKELDRAFAQGEQSHKRGEIELKEGQLTYRLGFFPFTDASGRNIGDAAVLHNTTGITAQSRRMMLMLTGMVIGCGIILFIVIYLILGRTQRVMAAYHDERQRAEGEIENLAFYDSLTRLPNRRLMLDRFKHALAASARNGRQGALLFIGLDNFKALNDTLGHDAGDMLLQQVAQRIDACVRDDDTVSRFGGDEFVVMLEGLSEQELEAAAQAETIGKKILAALGEPYQLVKHEYHNTASAGVTLFLGDRHEMEDLLKQADIAMLQAKKTGRNTLRFFDPAMQAAITNRVTMESDLRRATFMEGQLMLYYQPQVDSSGRWIGAEALVRWRHPERGMISPAEFIPLAEETGLILPLGHWVLVTACQQLVAWAARPETSHLALAVNISAKQFQLPTFVEEVLSLVDYFGISPARLKLEITESTVLGNVEDVIEKMAALKERGLCFSMDDFGTGYSSLSLLKRLPLNQLKIDQSFVRDILVDSSDAAISKMIVNLAQSMNLSVIAEGVESEAQRQFLDQHGCHAYQGYLFGKPVPIEEFEALITRG